MSCRAPRPSRPEPRTAPAIAGVLRFYDLAKHQEWQVRDVPWGEIPPVPEGKGSPAAAGAPARRLALGRDAAAPGGHHRRRDVGAAAERGARSRGEALLLDDGAGRVAAHRGVAEADRPGRRRGRARPAPRRAGAHVPRGGLARGEGLPHAGLLRAADHPALPADRALVARARSSRTSATGSRSTTASTTAPAWRTSGSCWSGRRSR